MRWPVGGIRTFHRYVYNNFSPDEYDFTLIAPDIDEVHILLNDLDQFQVKFIGISARPTFFEIGLAVFKTVRRERYSIVHAHGLTSALSAALPARLFSLHLLITLHDVFVGKTLAGIKGWVKKIVLSFLWAMAHTVHCVSYDCKENLLVHFPGLSKRPNKVVVISNGINTRNFLEAAPLDLRSKLDQSEPAFMIGFMGRFMAQKGFRYLVEALEIIIQQERSLTVKPLILTFGRGGFFREEKAILERKGILPYFRFLPFEANIASALKGLDLVVMPSLWEACGLLAMETLVAGVPLIASDCIGLREVLNDSPALMVPPGDSNALAKAILQEMRNQDTSKSRDFQSVAADRFDVRTRAKELDQLYKKIVFNLY